MPDQSSAATEHAILQEITRPLEALPDDPLSVVNADFPTALRGYERMAVDDYVRRTRQLVAELQATRSPEAAVRRALERVGSEITGILQRAHETAEEITAQSRREAEDRLEQARREAAQIADAAEQRVRELDGDTDRIWLERQRIVADAEDLAGQLVALARTAAERFPDDAETEGTDDAAAVAPVERAVAEPAVAEPEDEPEPTSTGPSFDTDDPDDEDEYFAEPDRRRGEEIEQTRAFTPLTPSGPDTGADPPSPPPAASPQSPPQVASDDPTVDRHPTSEDTTAVIRPASQAASRRLGH